MEQRARSQADLDTDHSKRAGRRSTSRRESLATPGIVMLSLVALAAMVVSRFPIEIGNLKQSKQPTSEAFRIAVNKAMSAAELTQTATFREDWHTVATLWHDAIKMMQAVPLRNKSYALAQSKVDEYQHNLDYAKDNSATRPAKIDSASVWSTNSVRELVTAIQGPPSRSLVLSTQCKEILYYGNSQIELVHGIVNQYSNVDNNLSVSFLEKIVAQQIIEDTVWTLGSPKEDIYAIEGTPERVNRYDSLDMEVLYYGDDIVELREGLVVAYSNYDKTLNASVFPILQSPQGDPDLRWSIGDRREDVFQAQDTPTQIQRRDSFCEEVIHYGTSTVNLSNGIVTGYDNAGGNLRVR
ncbi:MAG: hypothetical protein WBA10_17255 [Elainellaceae cyanobacterium]